MIKAVVLYDAEPDAARYAEHVEFCLTVPAAAFRHGRVFGAPRGEPKHKYFAEFEWPDMDAFTAAVRGPEFLETGKDAAAMGIPFSVEFVETS